MRAAIYARFSSDLQNERSTADQIRLCRDYALREGHSVVAVYEDAAASGASIHGRDGMRRLLADAERGGFDLLLAESMSRIGRDQEDRAAIRKRMSFHRVVIATPGDGVVTPLLDGVRAVLDSEQLEDLKRQTRRGMRSVVKDGRSAGGCCYGYDVVPSPAGAAPDKRGYRAINPQEADIVLRIFREYVSGSTPRDIAHGLNADAIAAPRGRFWNASTINGNAKRGNGILFNEFYVGRLVWNKVAMPKNPDTGKRVVRPNPQEQWVVHELPDLAIVPRDLFDVAQRRKAERSVGHPSAQRRPRHLLSGLLRCFVCDGGLSTFGKERSGRIRLRCSTRKESGACANAQTYYLDQVESAVLGGLRAELRNPVVLAEYVRAYHDERAKFAAGSSQRRERLARRVAEIDNETRRLVDAIAKGHGDAALLGLRIGELKREREGIVIDLAQLPDSPKVVALHPAILARYQQQVEQLSQSLGAAVQAGDAKAAAAIRDLVERVVVSRVEGQPSGVEVMITGRLNAVLGEEHYPNGVWGKAVAGARYGHQTHAQSGRFQMCVRSG